MDTEESRPVEVRSNDPLGMPVLAYEAGNSTTIEACRQHDGSRLWAVRCMGSVLSKDGDFEDEPLPSSRDADFLRRCRFATPLEARDALMAYLRSA